MGPDPGDLGVVKSDDVGDDLAAMGPDAGTAEPGDVFSPRSKERMDDAFAVIVGNTEEETEMTVEEFLAQEPKEAEDPDFYRRWALGSWFESAETRIGIMFLIVLNGILIGLETDRRVEGRGWEAVSIVFVVIFTLEIVGKLYAFQWVFWTEGWNVFDFLVVVVSLVEYCVQVTLIPRI